MSDSTREGLWRPNQVDTAPARTNHAQDADDSLLQVPGTPAQDERDHPSPGARLSAARKEQGLSLGDVARQLKLSVRQIEALERDDYDAFPSRVFVRGFLRNYAKLLQLDLEACIGQVNDDKEMSAAVPPAAVTPASVPAFAPAPRVRRLRWMLLAVVALLVVVALFRPRSDDMMRTQPGTIPEAGVQLSEPPRDQGQTQTATSSDPPSIAAPVDTTAESPAENGAAAVSTSDYVAGSAQMATAVEPFASPSEDAGALTLRFEAEAWVEIKDRAGQVVFSRLGQAGSEETVQGELPLSLWVGNAHAVRVEYRGRDVDLGPHTRMDVARLVLE